MISLKYITLACWYVLTAVAYVEGFMGTFSIPENCEFVDVYTDDNGFPHMIYNCSI